MSDGAKHVLSDLFFVGVSGLLCVAFVWFVGVVVGY